MKLVIKTYNSILVGNNQPYDPYVLYLEPPITAAFTSLKLKYLGVKAQHSGCLPSTVKALGSISSTSHKKTILTKYVLIHVCVGKTCQKSDSLQHKLKVYTRHRTTYELRL